jgi:hypothetical protein
LGLDCYVGTLTRYWTGDWELIAQKVARELGYEFSVIRPANDVEVERDPAVVRPVVEEWRTMLSSQLANHLTAPFDWIEGADAPYFTDKPTWDCYASLLLWAAYDEQRHLERPHKTGEEWGLDPAYVASTEADYRSRYMQLLDVSLWLPCRFGFVFEAEDPTGVTLQIGSSLALLAQLDDLNERTWNADKDLLEVWGRECPEYGSDLESGARFAFALMHRLAAQAAEHRLPMRLDW